MRNSQLLDPLKWAICLRNLTWNEELVMGFAVSAYSFTFQTISDFMFRIFTD